MKLVVRGVIIPGDNSNFLAMEFKNAEGETFILTRTGASDTGQPAQNDKLFISFITPKI